MASTKTTKVKAFPFFTNWSGHPIASLETALSLIRRARPSAPIIYFAGDSSLDNKAWVAAPTASYPAPEFPSALANRLTAGSGTSAAASSSNDDSNIEPDTVSLTASVPDIYKVFLEPPLPKPDVAFWLNHYLEETFNGSSGDGKRSGNASSDPSKPSTNTPTCLNTSIEATLLRHRDDYLLPQDVFIRDHITASDILIVSVGANDIALAPNLETIVKMGKLAHLTSRKAVEDGTAWGLGHFRDLFGDGKTGGYVRRLVEKVQPKAVIVCMIYFPLEKNGGMADAPPGWAERQLGLLGYNSDPGQLQAAIVQIFKSATSQISIPGTRVIPCALYEVLDCKDGKDYVERVEPSVDGGRKMGRRFCEIVTSVLNGGNEAV